MCIFNIKIMDIFQKNWLEYFGSNITIAIFYSPKMRDYFAWPLTLVHFVRAPAAVTHSMTE